MILIHLSHRYLLAFGIISLPEAVLILATNAYRCIVETQPKNA